jgi:general secretion pathway protein H
VIALRRPGSGFTLLELTVVLFILALVYAIAGPMLGEGSVGIDITAATRQLTAGLRRARSVAVTENTEAVLTLDVDGRAFSVTRDAKIYALPKKLVYTLVTAESEVTQGNVGAIRFYPDGSSTGGRITVSAGEVRQQVDVDWLTGRAHIL